jgi:hypothetical protein
MPEYEKKIVSSLLDKYYKRLQRETVTGPINREISIKPSEIFQEYGKKLSEDRLFNKAVDQLCGHGFTEQKKVKFSDEIQKIILCRGNVEDLIRYAEKEYSITPREEYVMSEEHIMNLYIGKGVLTGWYCDNVIQPSLSRAAKAIDPAKDKRVLELLDFIQNNSVDLYLREVSMLVFGSSKVLENEYAQIALSAIRAANNIPEDEPDADVWQRYHINDVNQEILLKGRIMLRLKT